ncbi:MAG: hypothetical protein K6357_08475 [Elusimicrobiota bacterium]
MTYLIALYGINSILAQTLIIREIASNFYSNEIFLSLSLAGWLGGSVFGVFLFKNKSYDERIIKTYHLAVPFLIILPIFIIKTIKINLSPLGENVDFFTASIISFFSSLIYSSFNGIYYIAAARKIGTNGYTKAYYIEAIGYAIGGLLLYILIPKLTAICLIIFTGILNILFLYKHYKSKNLFLFSLLFIVLSFITYNAYFKKSYLNKKIIETANSRFSKLEVYKSYSNTFIYSNSSLCYLDIDDISIERKSYIPMVFTNKNPKVALFGTDLNIASKILENASVLYVVDDDEKLFKIQKKYAKSNLNNLYFITPQDFFKKRNEIDLIIISNGFPQSIYSNRFYTTEFYHKIKKTLKNEGILSINLPYPDSIPSVELKSAINIVFKTLSEIFTNISVFYDDEISLIASDSIIKVKTTDIFSKAKFLNEDYIDYFLTKRLYFDKKDVRINHDKNPILFFYSILYETSRFYPKTTYFITKNANLLSKILFLFITIILILIFFKNRNAASMAITSFSMMSVEIISIFLFQLKYGYIYLAITIIIMLFMIGILSGVAIYNAKKISANTNLISLFAISLPFILENQPGFYLAAFAAGAINGYVFSKNIQESFGKEIIVYVFDIIGSAIATAFLPFFFISIFGFYYAAIYIAILNLIFLSLNKIIK